MSPVLRLTLALLWIAVAVPAWGMRDRAAELESLRDAISASRERVATYEREQRGVLETIDALDRSVDALRRERAAVRRRADEARERLKTVEGEAREVRTRLAATQQAMSRRAVALYKAGELGPVHLLFSADGAADLLTRWSTLRRLLDHDAALIDRHRSASEQLVDVEVRARAALEGRDAALAELSERSGQLTSERHIKRQIVSRLHLDRSRARAVLVELETASRALEETLSTWQGELEAAPQGTGPSFGSLRASLRAPVRAPIVESFGEVVDAEFHTKTFHKGVEFDAARGTEVRAVARGQVRFAGWFRGYGRLVIVDHGDQYFTVLGHLEEIRVAVGESVEAGAVVATVGDSGSLSGPRLYFEIRRGSQPLDPVAWLAPGARARR